MFKVLVFIFLLALMSGCGRNTDEIKAEWDEVVAGAIACDSDDQCIVVTPGCPLGCTAVINKANKAEVESKAEELRAEANSGGMSCSYSCIIPTDLSCKNKKCSGE